MNHEGYRDPTAEQAIRNVEKTPRRIMDVIQAINDITTRFGLEVVRVRDLKTGKEWNK